MTAITDQGEPTLDEVAEVLRWCVDGLKDASNSLVAFSDRKYDITRYVERIDRKRRLAEQMVERLPPEPPMTPEREAAVGQFIGAVLDKRFGSGSQEAVTDALDDLLDSGSSTGSDRAVSVPSPDGHNSRESGRSEP